MAGSNQDLASSVPAGLTFTERAALVAFMLSAPLRGFSKAAYASKVSSSTSRAAPTRQRICRHRSVVVARRHTPLDPE